MSLFVCLNEPYNIEGNSTSFTPILRYDPMTNTLTEILNAPAVIWPAGRSSPPRDGTITQRSRSLVTNPDRYIMDVEYVDRCVIILRRYP
jgi:hypothetical protein